MPPIYSVRSLHRSNITAMKTIYYITFRKARPGASSDDSSRSSSGDEDLLFPASLLLLLLSGSYSPASTSVSPVARLLSIVSVDNLDFNGITLGRWVLQVVVTRSFGVTVRKWKRSGRRVGKQAHTRPEQISPSDHPAGLMLLYVESTPMSRKSIRTTDIVHVLV